MSGLKYHVGTAAGFCRVGWTILKGRYSWSVLSRPCMFLQHSFRFLASTTQRNAKKSCGTIHLNIFFPFHWGICSNKQNWTKIGLEVFLILCCKAQNGNLYDSQDFEVFLLSFDRTEVGTLYGACFFHTCFCFNCFYFRVSAQLVYSDLIWAIRLSAVSVAAPYWDPNIGSSKRVFVEQHF
jgi:hypothetical protein